MITHQLVAEILALASIVVPITQAVKKWLKAEGTTAIIISAIVTILLALWRTLSIQPYDWKPDSLVYYFYFEMPQWARPGGVRTMQLVAFAKGRKWGSEKNEIRIISPPQ